MGWGLKVGLLFLVWRPVDGSVVLMSLCGNPVCCKVVIWFPLFKPWRAKRSYGYILRLFSVS